MMLDRNKGIHHNRIQRELLERIFAEHWDAINQYDQIPTLSYLVSDSATMLKPTTRAECKIAATVIQWLGSTEGQLFLDGVLSEAWRIKRELDMARASGNGFA